MKSKFLLFYFILIILIAFSSQFSFSKTDFQKSGNFKFQLSQGGEDNIRNSRIFTSNANVRAITGAVEQRGANAGRIWAIVVYSANPNFPDTFKVYNSVTNGQSWQYFAGGNIRPEDKVSYNDLDMEIIENTSGQKYMWVVFGYRQGGVSGPLKTGGFILQFPSFNGVFFNEMNWPAADSTKNYYDIHITSDNARYPGTANVFIACSFDSLDGNGNRIYGQRLARCTNPYSLAVPSFQYTPRSFYWTDASQISTRKIVYTDIAYFNNGGQDSLILSFSGAKDSSKIYFSKCDRAGNAPSTGAGMVSGLQTNDYKAHARLSSNGNENGSVVCTFRQFSNGNWNVKYISSANFGNFNTSFTESQFLGSNLNINYPPDIIGVRNGNTHYLSFITSAAADSLRFFSVNSLGIQSSVSKMNYYNSLGKEVGPKALFSYASNDSCLALYSEAGPLNMLSAAGCGGEPIGIVNLNASVPEEYALKQNYPNPFNPVTNIQFSIINSGFVSLKIYDILGGLVKELVNEYKYAGAYSIQFDGTDLSSGVYYYKLEAGNFSDTKRMVLVK